ncbi:RDD family protein [Falsibacillus albus]|uniref:RDD family protein n=1 Tax=Falsibacillus albus TaxID=2478915 RepID=A0A3L7K5L3_9BACI|nr:RDD family protein [Falsibacillus albus]RLQ97935.1 RDD family protein [Falsibacillus albus]
MSEFDDRHNQEHFSEESQPHELTAEDSIRSTEFHPPAEDDNPLSQLHFAGFWIRFWAYLLDLIIIGSISRLVVYPIFKVIGVSLDKSTVFAPAAIAGALVFYLYFVLMTKLSHQTLGKMVFSLKVIPVKSESLTWGTVIFREFIGRYISATVIILYLLVAFMPRKQGLHDIFADTAVIHERTILLEPARA